jgi:hypothetical protein
MQVAHLILINRMIDLQEEGRVNFTFPSIEIAKTFSVETIEYSRPLGYHVCITLI